MNCKILLLAIFIFPAIYFTYGQAPVDLEMLHISEREKMAEESIHAIYDGVLIVRLSSNARKTEVLQKQIADPYSSAEQRKLYKSIIKKSNTEIRETNEMLMAAMARNYDFSEVFFLYDTSLYRLTSGEEKGFFLSQDLEIDKTINLAGRPYRMARYGSPLSEGMQELLGIVVMNNDYRDLPPPFPYKSIGIRSGVVNVQKRKIRMREHFDIITKKLNRNFHQFHQAVKG